MFIFLKKVKKKKIYWQHKDYIMLATKVVLHIGDLSKK